MYLIFYVEPASLVQYLPHPRTLRCSLTSIPSIVVPSWSSRGRGSKILTTPEDCIDLEEISDYFLLEHRELYVPYDLGIGPSYYLT